MGNCIKRKTIYEYYRHQADILLLQETHSEPKDELSWTSQWGGPAIFSHGSTNQRGVAILFRKSSFFNVSNVILDFEGRFIGCNIRTQNGLEFALCNVYAPNDDRPSYFQALSQNIADLNAEKVLMGDFNLVMDVEMDRYESNKNNLKSQKVLYEIMDEYCLEEVWRNRHPGEKRFSWRHDGRKQASRIDFALVSKSLEQKCENILYFQGIQTDHSALIMSIKDMKHDRGVGYWKNNNAVLRNPETVEKILRKIERDIKESEGMVSKEARWYQIKENLRKYLKQAARARGEKKKRNYRASF